MKANYDEVARFARECLGEEMTDRTRQSGCGIVYCHTRADTHTLAEELSSRGVLCKAYHAKLNVRPNCLGLSCVD